MVLLKEIYQKAIIFAILADRPQSDSLYDYDALYKVWMNRMKIERRAEIQEL